MAGKAFKYTDDRSGWEVMSSIADAMIYPFIFMLVIFMFLDQYRFKDMELKITALEKKIETCK